MSDTRRAPYAGEARKLVVSIDVGTTFTAASFCILQPGSVPKFEEVLRWPKQATPDAKVPSVLYYDKKGCAQAFGAETEDEDSIINAEFEGWVKSEWFKLHLRPNHLPIIRNLKLPPLPPKTTVDKVFADHLRYIKQQLQNYITATYGEGANIWKALFPSMYVILTTPNGWEGAQQNRMRVAAMEAGLVDKAGGRRVRFVTEAEAAVLYAADSGSVGDWLVEDGHLILCDCGGGTIDITGYKITEVKPLKLEESAASRCYLAGAVFVTSAARNYLKARLAGTEWDNEDAIQRAVIHFDRNAKRKFDNPDIPSWVQLDGFKSNPALGIVRGRLKISGQDMEKFFEPSLTSIKQGLEIAFENGDQMAAKVILVGGLASSPYVYNQLLLWGEDFGISVSRPDGPTVKAVANGALAWHIDTTVSSRISKYHYGISVRLPYEKDHKEFRRRASILGIDGVEYAHGAWSGIVEKNTKISSGKEFASAFNVQMVDGQDFTHASDIYVYRRAIKPPMFIMFPGKTTLQPGFEVICRIQGDLKRCYEAAPTVVCEGGKKYKRVHFDVCLSLGETELTARMRWKEDGKYQYGPATVAYE